MSNKLLRRFFVRLTALLTRQRDEARLREELEAHLALQTEANIKAGLSPDEARRQAILKFGAVEAHKEHYREERHLPLLEQLVQDTRYAIRGLHKNPAFAVVAVLTLAMGIGATTAIFSLISASFLRPLPVKQPEHLITLTEGAEPTSSWPLSVWIEIRNRELLNGAFAWTWTRFNTAENGEKRFLDGIVASGRMFETLGIQPAQGRLLHVDDELSEVAIISYRFWQRQFSGGEVVGEVIRLDGKPFTIVGVTPREFVGLNIGLPFDVAIPLVAPKASTPQARFPYVTIMARMRPGEEPNEMTRAVRSVQPSVRDATNPYSVSPYREEYLREPFVVRPAPSGVSFLRTRYADSFNVLLGVSAVLLLISCGNVAVLFAVRALQRRYELSVRAALGARRSQLIIQVFAEAFVLAVAGAAVGLLVGQWLSQLLVTRLSTQAYTVLLNLEPDWRIIGFITTITVATAVLFGLAGAVHALRIQPTDALRRRTSTQGPNLRFASVVIVAQIALSVTLLIGMGLFVCTTLALGAIGVGFDASRVMVVSVDSATNQQDRLSRYMRLNDAVADVGGVESAGISLAIPGGNSTRTPWIKLSDGTTLPQGPNGVYGNSITPGWFKVMGTKVIAGREFVRADRRGMAIVNEEFVHRFLRNSSVIGQTILQGLSPDGPWQALEIVGVVENVMYRRLNEPRPPTVYTTLAEMSDSLPASVNLSVRTRADFDNTLSREIAHAISSVDADASLTFRELSDHVNAQYAQERLVAAVASFFGTLGVFLAALGLYGVTAYSGARQRFETGVRIALGATPRSVVRMMVSRTAVLIAIGLAVGTMMSVWLANLVESLLYGVHPLDAVTFALACTVCAVVAGIAAWLPARRAARVDPLVALRYE